MSAGAGRRRVLGRGVATLLAAGALAGCDVGNDVPRCTLDPNEVQVTSVTCSAPGTASIGGTAFSYGECGVSCPRPWTITVRWTNRTTGESGSQALGWHSSSCWPFASSSCGPDGFNLVVPVAPGTNEVELAVDEGDGYTACQVVYPGGC